jgi:hypothetical protein
MHLNNSVNRNQPSVVRSHPPMLQPTYAMSPFTNAHNSLNDAISDVQIVQKFDITKGVLSCPVMLSNA